MLSTRLSRASPPSAQPEWSAERARQDTVRVRVLQLLVDALHPHLNLGAAQDKALAGIWRLFRRHWAFRHIKKPGYNDRGTQYRSAIGLTVIADMLRNISRHLRRINLGEFMSFAGGRSANHRDLSCRPTAPEP
jgi:hypothetical protein